MISRTWPNAAGPTAGVRPFHPQRPEASARAAVWASALGVGAAVAISLVAGPLGGLVVLALTFAACALVLLGRRLPLVFLGALGPALVGYAFLSRGFAYLGIPPLYVGEMVLGLGVLAVISAGVPRRLFASPLLWSVALFGAWGAARTLPYLGRYGIDALRDAVIWGYGIFVLLVSSALLRTGKTPEALRRYIAWAPWFLAWVPLLFLLKRVAGDEGWLASVIVFKAGDLGVHLAGVATLALAGLFQRDRQRVSNRVLAALWLVGFTIAGAVNRGGSVSVAAAVLTLGALMPFQTLRRGARVGWRALPVAGALAVVAVLYTVAFPDPGPASPDDDARAASPSQLMTNLTSVLNPSSAPRNLQDTRAWRLEWWTTIEDYTLHGPYFWMGKGFGINLAEDDDFLVGVGSGDPLLRSPHNGHLGILARTGVPGLVLWGLVLASFAGTMIRGHIRARRLGLDRLAAVHAWVLAYWVAFLVNAAFDVYLEGPQGGIWFWSLMGFGLALRSLIPGKAELANFRHRSLRADAAA